MSGSLWCCWPSATPRAFPSCWRCWTLRGVWLPALARRLNGIHCHNDVDLAVALSLMAVEAGVVHVQGTPLGFGERTGNANLPPSWQILSSRWAVAACRRATFPAHTHCQAGGRNC